MYLIFFTDGKKHYNINLSKSLQGFDKGYYNNVVLKDVWFNDYGYYFIKVNTTRWKYFVNINLYEKKNGKIELIDDILKPYYRGVKIKQIKKKIK